ncbi:MAG: InlB B-repeat-containing protein [Lachnospiraceae bacterium]|nr:InlB B-repeat-containing protein [Lachnospiraceae bacterium]
MRSQKYKPAEKKSGKKKFFIIGAVVLAAAIAAAVVIIVLNLHFKVSFNISYNAPNPETQSVKRGEYAERPAVEAREGYLFVGWYEESGDAAPFDFSQPITKNTHLTALWYDENDTADADSDNLPDVLELFFGTDRHNPDSDGDGLYDGLEIRVLSLDPLKRDTDGNGVQDPYEDKDGEGFMNIEEVNHGTNSLLYDTDSDLLSDYDEVYVYHTDPLNPDSDHDGVADGRETLIGSNPSAANSSFTTQENYGTVSEYNPVSIEVSAVTDAAGAGTIEIYEISPSESSMFSEGGIGFLGRAYDLSCEGTLESAEITFYYDDSLGELSEYFQPRIYWYDEENDQLVEVPGQTVSEGKITATVTHFSIYQVRNKTIFDELIDLITSDPAEDFDTSVDSNDDGIPDIYIEMIRNKQINCKYSSNVLAAIITCGEDDPDWDDDGLKNGEEMSVVKAFGKYYANFHSDPTRSDTDGDGIGDYAEVKQLHTSPNVFDHRSVGALHQLENDGKYTYATFRAQFEESVALFLDSDKYDQAKNCIIDYFSTYTPEDTFTKNEYWAQYSQFNDEMAKGAGALSNVVGAINDIIDLVGDLDELEMLEDPYNQLQLCLKNTYGTEDYDKFSVKRADAVLNGMKSGSLVTRLESALDNLESSDKYKNIEGMTQAIGFARIAVRTYKTFVAYSSCSYTGEFKLFQKNASSLGCDLGEIKNPAGLVLTVFTDITDAVQSNMEVHSEYAKILANAEAFNMYLDMLIYLRDNVGDDASDFFTSIRDLIPDDLKELSLDYCIKCAAADIARDIADKSMVSFYTDLVKASARVIERAGMKIALDVMAEVHPVAKIVDVFIDLYHYTGIEELGEYTVYFTVMKYMSDACKYLIDQKVTKDSYTFSYNESDNEYVEKYMAQLAQIRIIGTYYMFEYCTQNTGASWMPKLWSMVTGQKDTSPTREQLEDACKRSILDVYKQARRLDLRLSKRLPYYFDTSHEAEPDEVEHVADLENLPESLDEFLIYFSIYRDTEGGAEYDHNDISGKSSTLLKWMLFNVPCCNHKTYGSEREEVLFSPGTYNDPKGWGRDEDFMYNMCYVYDLKSVKWIANNIFNVADADFLAMLAAGEEEKHFYASGEKIYFFTGGIGWEFAEVNIISARIENDVYRIVYSFYMPEDYLYATNFYDGIYYAEMEFKTFGDNTYWTLLKHSAVIPDDMKFTEDWSWDYYQFLISGEYINTSYYTMDEKNDYFPITAALHDMDADGVPELIVSSGGDSYASSTSFIYTYNNGEIRYLGMTNPYDGAYFTDPDYPGLVWDVAHTGAYAAYYYYIENGELQCEQIYMSEDDTDSKQIVELSRTSDTALYALYKKGDSIKTLDSATVRGISVDAKNWKDLVDIYNMGSY